MRPEEFNGRARQRGFSLVTAIFIVTVLAALGAFVLVLSGVAQQTPVTAFNSAQAYHAARSGLEYGISEVVNNGAAGCTTTLALGVYSVDVTCDPPTLHVDNGFNVAIYTVHAIATRSGTAPGDLAYVRRELRAVVSPSGPM